MVVITTLVNVTVLRATLAANKPRVTLATSCLTAFL